MATFRLHPQLAADTIDLGNLTTCKVLLVNDSQFPWIILVPRRNDIKELYDLSPADLKQVQHESISVAKRLMAHFNGDKLNVAALGNLVPQLHIHHIVRFKNDIAWPKPVWGAADATPYSEPELTTTCDTLTEIIF